MRLFPIVHVTCGLGRVLDRFAVVVRSASSLREAFPVRLLPTVHVACGLGRGLDKFAVVVRSVSSLREAFPARLPPIACRRKPAGGGGLDATAVVAFHRHTYIEATQLYGASRNCSQGSTLSTQCN